MSSPLNIVTEDPFPWYSNGLKFKCTGCGQCCTGAPGYVWVDEDEIIAIANELQISIAEFSDLYLRKVNGRYSLRENPVNHDCVFLKNNKCSVYAARPRQCITFPWWVQNLRSREDWDNAAAFCEGMNHPDAPAVPLESIQANLFEL